MGYEQWVVVFKTREQVEAALIRGLLETNGFPVIQEATELKSAAVFFGHSAMGELRLKVPPDRAEEALALIAADAVMPDEEPDGK